MLTAALIVLSTRSEPNFMSLVMVVGIGLALNLIYVALLWANFFPGAMAVMAGIFDALLAAVLLVLSGPQAPLLLPLMLFPVIMAGARWGAEGGLLIALPIALAYVVPVMPTLRGALAQPDGLSTLFGIGIDVIMLLVAGLLPGPFVHRRAELIGQANTAELQQLRLANERSKFVSELALTMSSTLDYRKVLRAMVDLAFSAMAEVGTKDDSTIAMVLLFEEGGEGSRLAVAAGRNIARTDEGRKVSPEEGLFGKTIRTADVVISHNAQNDRTLSSFASTRGIQSAICAPLRAGLTTYGVVLFCSTEPDAYNEDHKTLLKTFCSQAIIPLQNAQLFEDLQLEQQKILEKEAEARRKLARDLHDGPTQSIAAIVMRLNFIKLLVQNKEIDKAFDELIKVEEIAQHTTQEIRTMLFAMRPVILETQGLLPALEQYVDRLRQTERFSINLVNQGYEGQLSADAEGVVFAIVEEAIGNAKKHSQASQIRVSLVAQNDTLIAEVRDNGVGFDVATTQSTYDQRTSLGLINMDERAQLVGGDCTIESTPGRGTVVRLRIPFSQPVEV